MHPPLNQQIEILARAVVACSRCPRLRRYCEGVARRKRRAYRDEEYWGRPVPAYGDPQARLLIIGLAPAAHGGNRTGRVFTGDDSGHFLFRALHKAGFANQPLSIHRDDGLTLQGTYITAILHCAPPDNKPKPVEIKRCRPYLMEEIRLLKQVKVVLALGRIAFEGYLTTLKEMELLPTKPTLDFAHGRSYDLGPSLPSLFASYHPSRQNTQTGRLTEAMFDNLFRKINTVLREIHSIPITGTGRRA